MKTHNERLKEIRMRRAAMIQRMRAKGMTLEAIGAKLGGISKQAVSRILLRK